MHDIRTDFFVRVSCTSFLDGKLGSSVMLASTRFSGMSGAKHVSDSIFAAATRLWFICNLRRQKVFITKDIWIKRPETSPFKAIHCLLHARCFHKGCCRQSTLLERAYSLCKILQHPSITLFIVISLPRTISSGCIWWVV